MPAITKDEAIQKMRQVLEDIAEPADAHCGCSYPCRCDSEGAEAIRAGWMRGEASAVLAEVEHITDTAATQAESFSHVSMQSEDPKRVMMKAHAHCPADLAHPAKMAWMADFFLKHYVRPTAPTDLSAVEVPPLPESLATAWVTPLRYGSKVSFPKPPQPEGWDNDESAWHCDPLFSAEVTDNRFREGYAAGRATMKGNK